MLCRIGAFLRALAGEISRGPLMVLAGMLVLVGLSEPALAVVKDPALCFGDAKVAADRRIAACSVSAEDVTGASSLRAKAYFFRAMALDDKQDWDGAIAD